MLGNKIFYLDLAENRVAEGFIAGETVNEQGHAVFTIKDGEMYVVEHKTLCFETKEAAEAALPNAYAINQEIKRLQKDVNHKIDFLLEQLLGKPDFVALTIKGESVAA